MMESLEGREHVVLVDWASYGEKLVLVIARPPSDFQIHDIVGLTVSDVAVWKRKNLSFLDEDEECLRELDVLVAHLAESTDPDDLLILSPTGPLHGLPLHALLIGDKLLLERNRVVYSSSMSVLRQCMSRSAPRQNWHAAIFGNPTNDRAHGAASARQVGSLLHCEARIGKDANLASFRDLVPSANLIHYHGHARFDSENPLQSALILAEKRNLTAHDIFALPVVASLVVLIACSSGVQHIHPGDEPAGLTSAFLCAGANAVVGTLWPVEDVHGKEFSELFYKGFVSRGGTTIDLAQLLQMAVTEMRNRHPEPECWAAFFLQGDWILKDVPVFRTEN
jgi:CHAT domain-containing protein